jgi:hypothetical protein
MAHGHILSEAVFFILTRGERVRRYHGFARRRERALSLQDTHMASPEILLALGMPVAMAVSGVAVWRAGKKGSTTTKPDGPGWRDDSLDDWRKERDARAEAERKQRPNTPTLRTGAEEQAETTTKHQRLGG